MMSRDMYLLIAAFVLIAGLAGGRGMLVDESAAVRHLDNLGFSDVTITHKAWFAVGFRGCSEKDAAKFTASAINPAGKPVEVEVCVGWPFKGATLRS